MKVAVIPWNDEWRPGIIFSARDYADRVLVITSNEIVEELARTAEAEIIKLKDYDKINAVYLGLKKAKEMGCKPVFILEELSKEEFASITPLLKDAEFIVGSKYISENGVRKCEIFDFKDSNYRRILKGYEPKDPNLLEKVFYVIWCLITGLRIAIKRLLRKVRH
ncbi:hypothetical protein [Geoglobus acetivorans]|uniref:Uncharacterized protein n=1 Tax=Geoglobus acetivorans TaxID=565033 RepID=A0ABZ3H4C4_GEOAI|nr:hypothetical protein [Geoglobus acetivorans]